jgi:hypothetical protein
MINLDAVFTPEHESTIGTGTALPPQQMPKGTAGEGMMPEALRPEGEVAIKRGGGAVHLHMAFDGGVTMAAQGHAISGGKDPPTVAPMVPVALDRPINAFVPMSSAAPPQKHLDDRVVTGLEGHAIRAPASHSCR